MSPNDIKRIINCVVDYGWPFQRYYISGNDGKLWKTEEDNQSIFTLLKMLSAQAPVRLDPNHVWDWPIETREGMPCWARDHNTWHKGFVLSDGCVLCGDAVLNIVNPEEEGDFVDVVAPHPLNPTMEPPANWQPENKRILK